MTAVPPGAPARRRRPADGAAATAADGAAGGPPARALLLHGLAGAPAVWEPFVARAPGDLELWVADLPWSAEAAPRWDHRVPPARIMTQVLEAVAGGPEVVVAHSYSAGLLLELLASGGGPRPAAAVLVSPFYRPATGDFDWATMEVYMAGFHRIIDEGLRIGAAGRLPGDLRDAMSRRVRDRVGPYGWIRFFDAYLRTPFLDTAAIDVPVLIVTGEDDIAAPPSDARALARALPDGRAETFAGCGHFPPVERPDAFAAAVRGFLSTVLPSPSVPAATALSTSEPA